MTGAARSAPDPDTPCRCRAALRHLAFAARGEAGRGGQGARAAPGRDMSWKPHPMGSHAPRSTRHVRRRWRRRACTPRAVHRTRGRCCGDGPQPRGRSPPSAAAMARPSHSAGRIPAPGLPVAAVATVGGERGPPTAAPLRTRLIAPIMHREGILQHLCEPGAASLWFGSKRPRPEVPRPRSYFRLPTTKGLDDASENVAHGSDLGARAIRGLLGNAAARHATAPAARTIRRSSAVVA